MLENEDSFFSSSEHNELIGLIYDSVDHPKGFFPFIHKFIEVFDGLSACFAIYDLRAGRLLGVWSANMSEEALAFYAEHVASKDLLLETALRANESGSSRFVASNLDIENVEEVRSKANVGQFMALLGAHDAVGAVAFRDDNYLNFFTMQRSIDQPPFSSSDKETFDHLLPHINRAVRLYTKLANLGAEAYTPERTVLEDLKRGILICDTNFRVIYKNAYAEEIISRNTIISITDKNLLVFENNKLSAEAMIALTNAVRASVESRPGSDTILSLPNGKKNVTITFSPLIPVDDASYASRHHRGGAIINLYDWSMRRPVEPIVLEKIFGLSPAEAKVAAKLVEGASISDIAAQTFRTRDTIKSQLKAVFRKTNTNRQGELVALLSATGEIT